MILNFTWTKKDSMPVRIVIWTSVASVLLLLAVLLRTSSGHHLANPIFSQVVLEAENTCQWAVPQAGIQISTPEELGKTKLDVFKESVQIGSQSSIKKVVGIHPARNHALQAQLAFHYDEEDLGDLDESQLILYSSTDGGDSWQAHPNSKVDPHNNSIHLSGIEHFSLWTAAPALTTLSGPGAPGGVSSNLSAWYKANSDVTGTTQVTQWDDQSGNGFNLAQGQTNRWPALADASESFNFNPSIDFDGVNKHLETGVEVLPSNSAGTVFAVATHDNLGGYDNLVVFGVDNPHLGTFGTNPVFYMRGSGPIRYVHSQTVIEQNSYLYRFAWDSGANVGSELGFSGIVEGDPNMDFGTSGPNSVSGGGQGDMKVGAFNDVEEWNGNVAEVVVYNTNLSSGDKQKVESYLAIKYGLTLDQTTPYSYLAGNGNTVWDAATNAAYSNDIAGIGRDDCQELDQRQSKSVNESSILTIYNGDQTGGLPAANTDNASGFASDVSFMVWGSNALGTDYGVSYTPNSFTPVAPYFHMDRKWRVEEYSATTDVATVTLRIPANLGAEHLLVHNDEDFSTGTPTEVPLSNDGNGNLLVTYDFQDGDYFTFGNEIEAPGCVATNLRLWLKADVGVTESGNVSQWKDQSALFSDFVQGTASDQPVFLSNSINFNPALDFNNSQSLDCVGCNPNIIPNTAAEGDPLNIAYVVIPEESGGRNSILEIDNGGAGDFPSFEFNGLRPGIDVDATTFQDAGYHTSSVTINQPVMVSTFWNNQDNPNGIVRNLINGGIAETLTGNGDRVIGTDLHVGAGNENGNSDPIDGIIPEIILYNAEISATDLQKIHSYLAIKYGLTLDQTTPLDYLDGDGTVIWDATANAAFSNNIAGIGLDECQALDQRQSMSVNDGTILTIYNGDQTGGLPAANINNATAFTDDQSFMVWGNNDAEAIYTTLYDIQLYTPAGGYYHMDRIWQVQETSATSDVGTVTVAIPTSANADHLLVNDNADFSTGTPDEIPLTDNGSGYLVATFDFEDGDYFTFGAEIIAPGCVPTNLLAWYKFDFGLTTSGGMITDIEDATGNGLDLTQASAGQQPDFTEDALNFNPGGFFDGGNDALRNQYPDFIETTDPVSLVSVSIPTNFGGERRTIAIGDGFERPGLGHQGSSPELKAWGASGADNVHSVAQNLNTAYIMIGTANNDPTKDFRLSYNGIANEESFTGGTGEFPAGNTGYIALGNEPQADPDDYQGYITEAVIYNRVLDTEEKERIYSYLAVKYGITLSQNYYAGDWNGTTGTTLWDITADAAYSNGIAGIGREDCQALDQRQSKSADADNTVAIYNGDQTGGLPLTNAANAEAFAADQVYMLWGHNAGNNTYTETVPNFDILERQWLVHETGTVGTVTVNTSDATAEYLVVDTDGDGDFSTGTLTYEALASGSATYDFSDGDYFTFGQVSCITSNTYACSSGNPVNLTSHVLSYTAGGTWTDVSASGADISDPTNVDITGLADGVYIFNYQFPASILCYDVVVNQVSTIPAPMLDDKLVCDGDDVTINVPFFDIPQEEVFHADFAGTSGFVARGECSGSTIGTCPVNDETLVTDEGLTLSGDFSTLYRLSDYIRKIGGEMRFYDVNSEFCLETPLTPIAPGDEATISVDLRRSGGFMESDDYIRIYSVVDGVPTLEAEYSGQISSRMQTFRKTGITGSNVLLRVCVKSGNGEYGIGGFDGPLEHYAIGDMKIVITPALPVYNFYDADPAGSANLLATGQSYDPGTTAMTSPESVWVTCLVNGCESEAEEVMIDVSPNTVQPMGGTIGYYCPGGPGADPTINLVNLVTNYQAGGTWNDDDASGVSLVDPTAVDFTGIADGVYHFTYTVSGAPPCNGESSTIIVSIGQDADDPIIENLVLCEGDPTIIELPLPDNGSQTLFDATFDGATEYVAQGECTGAAIGTCATNDETIITSEGLSISGDFSTMIRRSDYIRRINGEIRFHDLNSEFCLETPAVAIPAGGEVVLSVDLRRSGGFMESDDYIRVYSIIDGVPNLEQEYSGQISAQMQTFRLTGVTGTTAAIRVCVKNGDGMSGIGGVDGPLEHYAIGGMQVIATPALPTYLFYDADPGAGPANLLASGMSYDPGTTPGTSPETVWVVYRENGCESDAVPVQISVSSNPLMEMDGYLAHYCSTGPDADPLIDFESFVINHQPGGTWTDDDASGVNLADPTAVDVSGLAAGIYHYTYTLAGMAPCSDQSATIVLVIDEMGEESPTLS